MMKVNMVGKGTMKLMKPFKTLEEEAEFWGRQDVAERIKDGAIVGVHSAEKTDTLTIRFSHEDIQKLRDEASVSYGLSPSPDFARVARNFLQDFLGRIFPTI